MPTTSWCCAKATKKQRPPWCESVPGSRTTVFVCIRTKRILATAANEAKGLNSSATGFEAGGRYVRKKSLDRLKDSIRAKTRRSCGQSLARVIESLNRTLQGWFNYFKHAHHRPRPVHSTGVACNP